MATDIKVSASGSKPGTQITAIAELIRNKKAVETKDIKLKFNSNRVAESEIEFAGSFAEGDYIRTTVLANGEEFTTKCIGYEDLSKTVDVLMVAGQSNALGQYADKTESIKPEKGTVFYNTMGNNTLAESGDTGWTGALAKQWHDRTGHTVLLVKAAWGGTGFRVYDGCYGLWGPNATAEELAQCKNSRHCYKDAKTLYNNAIASLKNNTEYKIGDRIYFWNQGENENGNESPTSTGYTPQQYEEAFMEMHNGFLTEFGDADTRLMYGGILPVRSSNGVTYPDNLHLTGPRVAQYHMAATEDKLCLVSDVTENWYSDETVSNWFNKKYGSIGYTNGDMPTVFTDIMRSDKVHYNQKAHNEMGRDAANKMLAYLNGEVSAKLNLITPKGIQYIANGGNIYLTDKAIPVLMTEPGNKAEFEIVSGTNAVIDEFGVINVTPAGEDDYSVLKVTADGIERTYKIYTSGMGFGAEIASVMDNKDAIYTFVTDDGVLDSVKWYTEEFKDNGLKGTVALVTDWVGTKEKMGTWTEWKNLIDVDGSVFTAANHSKSHKTLTSLSDDELNTEVNDSLATIKRELPNQKVLGFCLPYNAYNDNVKNAVKENHFAMRASGSGLNNIPTSREDLYGTKFQIIRNNLSADVMNSWVDDAISQKKWLMELWHGVEATDEYTTTKEIASNHFEYLGSKKDKIWIADWDDVITYTIQRLESKLTLVSLNDSKMVIRVTDNLDDNIFDSKLTLNVKKPERFGNVTVKQGDATLNFTEKDGVISFNINVGKGDIIIEKA